MRALLRRLAKQNAVIGDNTHWITQDARKPTHQGGAEESLKFVQFRAIDDPRDHLAHIVGDPRIGRHHAVYFTRRIERFARLADVALRDLHPIETGDGAAHQIQRMSVIVSEVISDARGAAVDVGAAQFLGADHFAGSRLYQRWPREKNRTLLGNDNRLVGHGRHIGPTGGARTHHRGDLRYILRRHVGLIKENSTKVLAVGKHLVLTRQVGAARVNQINTR